MLTTNPTPSTDVSTDVSTNVSTNVSTDVSTEIKVHPAFLQSKDTMFKDMRKFQERAIRELGLKPENLSRADSELCLDVSGHSNGADFRNIVDISLFENGYGYFFATRTEKRNGQLQHFRKAVIHQFFTESEAIDMIRTFLV